MKSKGVILYRVSTDDQDFQLQKNKNREYCKQNEIEIVGEYTEFDVSGYKTQLKDRTELLKILTRAEEDKDFEYLIVYNSDRIIRREDEAPFVLSHLNKYNITVIETMSNTHINNENMSDKLMNYIRFWQAEYESVKTSQRVADALRAKNKKNEYTGGRPAFGYEVYNTDEVNHKGKVIKDLKINESEAWIVRDIFDMYVNKNMGSLLIAEELNSNPLYKGKNRPFKRKGEWKVARFRQSTIIRMIRNPIYIGRQRYNTVKNNRDGTETLEKDEWMLKDYREDLRVIDDKTFNLAQEIAERNTVVPNQPVKKVTKSEVLCSGIVYCECGAKLSSSFSRYRYKRKDGSYSDYGKIYRYVCREGRESNRRHKEKYGKTYFAAKKYDGLVEQTIIEYLESIDIAKLKDNIGKYDDENIKVIKDTINKLKEESKQCYRNIDSFENKIDEDIDNIDIYIKGIRRNEARAGEINEELNKLNEQLNKNEKNIYDYQMVYENMKDYYNDFISDDLESKKLILDKLVERIVFKANGIQIHLKTTIEESLSDNTMSMQYYSGGYQVANTHKNIDVIIANFEHPEAM